MPPRYPSNMVKNPPKLEEDTHQSERDSPSNDPRNDKYKFYFYITFCSDSMYNKILKVRNLDVGVKFLTFKYLLLTDCTKIDR